MVPVRGIAAEVGLASMTETRPYNSIREFWRGRRSQQDFEWALERVAEGLGPFRSVLAVDIPKTVRFIVDHQVPSNGSQFIGLSGREFVGC